MIILSHAVRKGGNIGAHFDLEKEPDKEAALAAIDLVEYLLDYVFVLPKKVEALGNKLKEIGDAGDDEEDSDI